jgi:Pyridoxamine 5'-phosphate oxidase
MTAEELTAEIHGFSQPDAIPTPWADGLERLRAADTYWVSTVRPDGRPHVTPVVAVWHEEALWFATGPTERKAKNLASNPSCVVTVGRSDLAEGALDVMLEGRVEGVTDKAQLEPVAGLLNAKYPNGPWHFIAQDGGFTSRDGGSLVLVFRVRHTRALGFRKGDYYSQTTWEGWR